MQGARSTRSTPTTSTGSWVTIRDSSHATGGTSTKLTANSVARKRHSRNARPIPTNGTPRNVAYRSRASTGVGRGHRGDRETDDRAQRQARQVEQDLPAFHPLDRWVHSVRLLSPPRVTLSGSAGRGASGRGSTATAALTRVRTVRFPALAVASILLLALSLRIPTVSLGPLMPEIRSDTGHGETFLSLLTTIPLALTLAVAPLTPRIAARFGRDRVLGAALAAVVLGTLVRSVPGDVGVLAGTALLG